MAIDIFEVNTYWQLASVRRCILYLPPPKSEERTDEISCATALTSCIKVESATINTKLDTAFESYRSHI